MVNGQNVSHTDAGRIQEELLDLTCDMGGRSFLHHNIGANPNGMPEQVLVGFMNNGVSITADTLDVNLPPSKQKVKVRLSGMQIINGCQTVNALYHAKYAPELKDRFQGNSNVLVPIYQIAPENKPFLDALIIATNSQNANC